MKMVAKCIWTSLLIALVGATLASAGIITPVEALSTSFWGSENAPAVLISGYGLSGNGAVQDQTHSAHVSAFGQWHAGLTDGGLGGPTGAPPPVAEQALVFDLGFAQDVEGAYVWQMNQNNATGRGTRNLEVLVSADTDPLNATWTSVGAFQIEEADGVNPITAQYLSFGHQAISGVRLVKFDIQTAWSGSPNEYVGLSEVRFKGITGPYDPTPADDAIDVPDGVNLLWYGDEGALGYEVYFGTDPNDAPTHLNYIANVTEPNIPADLLPQLKPGETYYWHVRQFSPEKEITFSFTTRKATQLVLYWPFEDGDGTIVSDASNHGNRGLLVGDSLPAWTDGVVGGALEFFGDTDGVDMTAATLGAEPNALPIRAESFTLSMLVYVDQDPDELTIIGGIGNTFDLGLQNYVIKYGGQSIFWGNGRDFWPSEPFKPGRWEMITYAYDAYNQTMTSYRNGIEGLSGPMSPPADNVANEVHLAPSPLVWGGGGELSGKMDDFRVYTGVLTPAQVKAIVPWAQTPTPANGAVEIPTDVTLTWKPGYQAGDYSVAWGDAVDPNGIVNPNVVTGLTTPELALTGLDIDTTYYWQVTTETPNGPLTTPVIWSFTTVPPRAINPFPANRADDVDPTVILGWTSGAGNGYHHHVYLNDSDDLDAPEADFGVQAANSFDPAGELSFGERYYWRIDEIDPDTGDIVALGTVWTFWVLQPECVEPPVGDVTGDCVVDLFDLGAMNSSWLDCGWDYAPLCP